MLGTSPPIRMICTGRTFRPDPVDATHSPVFSQVEGFAVDRDLTMADLKSTLDHFAASVFGDGTVTRLRPHRFAYTEPSVEVDVVCAVCHGTGGRGRAGPCRTCGGEGWIEWGGCGMVHPRALVTCGIDPDEHRGFTFGMGIERTLMLRHGPLAALRRDVERGEGQAALFEQGATFTVPAGADRPPRPPADRRPTDERLRALRAAIPAQPHHVAAVTAGGGVGGSWRPGLDAV